LTPPDYKINFNEPILKMIERLKNEHQQFELRLKTIIKHIGKNDGNRNNPYYERINN
jgi:hypothetical protein